MSDFFIYLDTQDAIDVNPSNANFNINLNFNSYTNPFISLEEVCMQNLVYPINSNYNTIVVEENSLSTITVSLEEKFYNGTEFAQEIQDKLNAGTAESITYTVTIGTNNRKLTISADGANVFQILQGTTCLRELGLIAPMDSAVISFTMPYPIRLDGSEYVDVVSNVPLNNISSDGRTNILARIFLTNPFGTLQVFENNTIDKLRINTNQFTNMNIRLFDDRGNIFQLPFNCNVSYIFKFTI